MNLVESLQLLGSYTLIMFKLLTITLTNAVLFQVYIFNYRDSSNLRIILISILIKLVELHQD